MKVKIFSCLLGILVAAPVYAKDFGKVGNSFEVVEEGFVVMMKRKLANIDLKNEQNKMQKLAQERVSNPPPIEGIKRAKDTKVFYYDPSFIVEKDIVLPGGSILHEAGTRVNPLDHMDLERRMFFIDGRDKEQVEWLRNELTKLKEREACEEGKVEISAINRRAPVINRVILVGGRIFELQKDIGHELYFDQAGELTTKFNISAVPAVVWQEGKKLKIKEIAIDE